MASQTRAAPLSDPIIFAVSRLVDDAQVETREPSHYQLEVQIKRAGLGHADPNLKGGKPVGKMKRLQIVLSNALEHDRAAGERLVGYMLSLIQGLGGFRPTSHNYVGEDAIRSAALGSITKANHDQRRPTGRPGVSG